MEEGRVKNDGDLYAVLGLNNKCTQADLRNAYKNLALKWHPDRCSKTIDKEEAKKKFQSVQRAYSVLSDANNRLLYDVGAYESDDDEIGMGDFLNEMVTMMDQTKSTGEESLEELKRLFDELFKDDFEPFGTIYGGDGSHLTSSSYESCDGNSKLVHKNNLSIINSKNTTTRYSSCQYVEAGGPSKRLEKGKGSSRKKKDNEY